MEGSHKEKSEDIEGESKKSEKKIEILVNKNLSKKIKQIKKINLKPTFNKQLTDE
mgnify:CR=1 FL=1